jgi:hypothetical protein
MEKHCPLCGKKEWNYDIVVSMDGLTFCGDCWHEIKQEAYKIGYWPTSLISKSIYKKALCNAKKLITV